MEYFAQFKNMMYSFDPASMDFYTVRNIFARVKLLDAVLNNSLVYYPYSVQDGDTMEMIAHKYYGSSGRHWIVAFSNKVVDPYFDFPLNQMNLEKNIIEKYGDVVTAQATLDHVEQQIVTTTSYFGNVTTTYANTTMGDIYGYDFGADAITIGSPPGVSGGAFFVGNTTVVLDDGTVVQTTTSLVPISQYDNEVRLNEQKRQIQLLDKRYVDALETELQNLLGL